MSFVKKKIEKTLNVADKNFKIHCPYAKFYKSTGSAYVKKSFAFFGIIKKKENPPLFLCIRSWVGILIEIRIPTHIPLRMQSTHTPSDAKHANDSIYWPLIRRGPIHKKIGHYVIRFF